MTAATVARISIAPVKSLGLVHPDSVELTAYGVHGDRVFAVSRVRRRDIDRVDFGVGAEGVVPGIRPRYAVSLRERARPTLIA